MPKSKKRMTRKASSKRVTFTFDAPDAHHVTVAGTFNEWNSQRTPLKRLKTGTWKGNLTLQPGAYEYKFVVDGNWITDPKNQKAVDNTFGTRNSLIEV